MKRFWASLIGFAALVAANSAWAQSTFPTQNSGVNAPGTVDMCRNSVGVAVPCGDVTPLSIKITNPTPITPYPTGSFAITGNSVGSTAAVVGTLAAFPGRTTYICGFNVQAIGGTATVGPITVAGLTGSSQVYQTDVNSATVGKTVAQASFAPCIPSATLNTAITITTTANGTATAVDVNSWGYQL